VARQQFRLCVDTCAKEIVMKVAHLPFLVVSSHAVTALLGRELDTVAVLALKAILRNQKGLEIAHQQIRYREHNLAFSSRIGRRGDLILELDIGDPRLDQRLVLEEELRRATRNVSRSRGTDRGRPVW
jgi:hypothetical protein